MFQCSFLSFCSSIPFCCSFLSVVRSVFLYQYSVLSFCFRTPLRRSFYQCSVLSFCFITPFCLSVSVLRLVFLFHFTILSFCISAPFSLSVSLHHSVFLYQCSFCLSVSVLRSVVLCISAPFCLSVSVLRSDDCGVHRTADHCCPHLPVSGTGKSKPLYRTLQNSHR